MQTSNLHPASPASADKSSAAAHPSRTGAVSGNPNACIQVIDEQRPREAKR